MAVSITAGTCRCCGAVSSGDAWRPFTTDTPLMSLASLVSTDDVDDAIIRRHAACYHFFFFFS